MVSSMSYVPKFCEQCGDVLADWNESGFCSRTQECSTARLRKEDTTRKSQRPRFDGDACGHCGEPIAYYNATGYCSRTTECKQLNAAIRRTALKLAAFEAYGGARCACCGETRIYFLTIDHVNGDGYLDRPTRGAASGSSIWWKLKKLGYPDKERYQVLCFNCNCAKRTSPSCPCSLERDS
jgi:hypothetical protein